MNSYPGKFLPLKVLPLILFMSAGVACGGHEERRIYFGTTARGESRGIYMAQLDIGKGTLSPAVRVTKAARPAFITLHPDRPLLYATGAGAASTDPSGTTITSFRVEEDGVLTELNTQPSGGTGACHLSLSPSPRHVMAANYGSGSCAILPILSDGQLAPPSSEHQHTGSSLNPKRQDRAHAHSINASPNSRFIYVADLGIDKIMIYRFNAAYGKLEPHDTPFIHTVPGGGPRHFSFHPDGKVAFANLELSSEVCVYALDSDEGTLKFLQTVSSLPEEYNEPNTSAEIKPSHDGRFLYVSNRGHDSIAIFSIDEKTYTLTLLGFESTRGEVPRHFNIDPSGRFMIVANQESSTVCVFAIDQETGMLEFTGSEISVPNPSCVQFYQ